MTNGDGRPDVAGLRQALEASTQGEWRGCHDGDCPCGCIWSIDQDFIVSRTNLNHEEELGITVKYEVYTANAKFTARAHNDMPAILAHIERLESLCERAADVWQAHYKGRVPITIKVEEAQMIAELRAVADAKNAEGG